MKRIVFIYALFAAAQLHGQSGDLSPALQRYFEADLAIPVSGDENKNRVEKDILLGVTILLPALPDFVISRRPIRTFLPQHSEVADLEITSRYGMFCRLEWAAERKYGFAPRFRLGTLEETNRIEREGF